MKKLFLLVCVIFCGIFQSYSQNVAIQDFIQILNDAQNAFDSGDYHSAIQWYEKSSKIIENEYGDDHPSFATGLSLIAACYREMKEYKHAIQLYEQALEIIKNVYGIYNLDYVILLEDIAVCYKYEGDYKHGERLTNQAMEIRFNPKFKSDFI